MAGQFWTVLGQSAGSRTGGRTERSFDKGDRTGLIRWSDRIGQSEWPRSVFGDR